MLSDKHGHENIIPKSSEFKLIFNSKSIITFEVIKESFTIFDKDEIIEQFGKYQIITNSKYLQYVEMNHGWYKDVIEKKGLHYRICTEDEVIDIVSVSEPLILNLSNI